MAFWSTPLANMDPKRSFRFTVKFFGPVAAGGAQTPIYLAQTVDRPVPTVSGGTKVDFLDKSFNFPGKVTWNEVKIKFVDGVDAGENMARKAYDFLKGSGFVGVGNNGYGEATTSQKTISKASALSQVIITALKTDGTASETYELNSAFITTTTLTGFNYGSEEVATAEFTFKYDWATIV